MKLPEREIQKSLSILKAHHFLSALQEQEKSVFEEDSSKKGAVSLPVVWDVHMWETGIYCRDATENGGEDDVSMATSVMETSVHRLNQWH